MSISKAVLLMTDNPRTRIESTVTVTKADGSAAEHLVSIGPPPTVIEGAANHIEDMARVQYGHVRCCIYCGATSNLTREHIVPFGLSGTAVLPSASCPTCRNATSAFETAVLRGPMRDVRIHRRLRSRSKFHGAALTGRVEIVRAGISETVELPLHQFPILLHFPTFERPGFLVSRDVIGVNITGITSISFGADPTDVLRSLGAESIRLNSRLDHPIAFARMIAKIGYATA